VHMHPWSVLVFRYVKPTQNWSGIEKRNPKLIDIVRTTRWQPNRKIILETSKLDWLAEKNVQEPQNYTDLQLHIYQYHHIHFVEKKYYEVNTKLSNLHFIEKKYYEVNTKLSNLHFVEKKYYEVNTKLSNLIHKF
jgi:hypothetical protein